MQVALVALFALLAGSIRGLNLLVVLAAAMLGLLIIQWRFSRANLVGLVMRREMPEEALAGEPFQVRFTVTNPRWFLAAWTLRVEDRVLDDRRVVRVIPLVRPRTTRHAAYTCVVRRRGHYQLGPARLTTGFPFGIVYAWREGPASQRLVVYPRWMRMAPHWMDAVQSGMPGTTVSRWSSGRGDGEFYGIRQWHSGDSPRWIHWRTAARLGRLAVRQYERQTRVQMHVLVDAYQPEAPRSLGGHPGATRTAVQEGGTLEDGTLENEPLERAIQLAASMVFDLTTVPINRVTLGVAEHEPASLAAGAGMAWQKKAMELLAGARPTPGPPLAETLVRMLGAGNVTWPVWVVSPRPPRWDLLEPTGGREIFRRLDLTWITVGEDVLRTLTRPGAMTVGTA